MIGSWTFFWLVEGSRVNIINLLSDSTTCGVFVLLVSMQLTSSTWWWFQQNNPKVMAQSTIYSPCCCYSLSASSLWSHGLQHARLRCRSLSPRVCLNSCPLSQWYHSTVASSITPFSFPQSSTASGSFLMSWLSASGGRSIGASALASGLPINIWGRFLLGSTGLISLLSKGLSRVFSNTTVQKHQFFFGAQPSLESNSHICMWLLKTP